MRKIVLAPDSFKGTMSSTTVCAVMEREIKAVFPACQVVSFPIADGGEGSVECFLAAVGGEKRPARVSGVFGEEMEAFYGILAKTVDGYCRAGGLGNGHAGGLDDGGIFGVFDSGRASSLDGGSAGILDAGDAGVLGDAANCPAADGTSAQATTAVIEMACCAGLPLAEGRLDPMAATTYGVGQLILDAAKNGASRIILGLGGSATNDAGCGMAAACGARFMDASGRAFVPTGGTLKAVARVDLSALDDSVARMAVEAMCDIDNPLFGPQGAACVFGPQKGADASMVAELDFGLRHLCAVCKADLGVDLSGLPGGGAAGGMGAGAFAFLGAKLRMGIDVVLDAVGFDMAARDADLVITGEGRIDGQSMRGKAAIGVARRAKSLGIPVAAVVGEIADGSERAYDEGVSAIFSINSKAMDFSLSKRHSEKNLGIAMQNAMRFAKAVMRQARA